MDESGSQAACYVPGGTILCHTCRVLVPTARALGVATQRAVQRLAVTGDVGPQVRYGLPAAGMLVALLVMDTTADLLPGGGAFLLLLTPVIAASTALGCRAGVSTLVIGAIGAWILAMLRGHPWMADEAGLVRLTLYLAEGSVVVVLSHALRSQLGIPLAGEDRRSAGTRAANIELAEPLTAREVDVLTLAAAGRQVKEIGSELFISKNTVKSHLAHAYDKLGATNRTEAVMAAMRAGILDVDAAPASPGPATPGRGTPARAR